MMDFLTAWNAATQTADLVVASGDLAGDGGFASLAMLYLGTDRLADPDDVIPGGSTDRRGTWTDTPLAAGQSADLPPPPVGCRWWLLSRAKATEATRQLFIQYAIEALQPLIDSGAAGAVDVQAWYQTRDTLYAVITITRAGPDGVPVNHVFDAAWTATLGVSVTPQASAVSA